MNCRSCGHSISWNKLQAQYVNSVGFPYCYRAENSRHKPVGPVGLRKCAWCKKDMWYDQKLMDLVVINDGIDERKTPFTTYCDCSSDAHHHETQHRESKSMPNNTSPTWEEVQNVVEQTFMPDSDRKRVLQRLEHLWDTPENAPVGQIRMDSSGDHYIKLRDPNSMEFPDRVWLGVFNSTTAHFYSHEWVRRYKIVGELPK